MTHFYTAVQQIGNAIWAVEFIDGVRQVNSYNFQPTLYTVSKDKTDYITLEKQYAKPIQFDSIYAAKDWVKNRKDVSNLSFHGNTNYVTQFILEKYGQEIDYDLELINVGKFDIETDSENGFPDMETADQAITSIAYVDNEKIYHVWGLKEYSIEDSILEYPLKENIRYYHCKSEVELLTSFINMWKNNPPDIITGWYIRLFDLPYLIRRIERVLGANKSKVLSPFRYVRQKNIKLLNREHIAYDIGGIAQLDYMDLFRKFGYTYGTQESYKLDHIAHVILGERKISYEEYGNLAKLYRENHQLFIDYNIKDTALIERMDEKLQFISIAAAIAYKAGSNFDETFGTVGIWESILYRELLKKNIVVPNPEVSQSPGIPGAFVKDPVVGLSKWVCSFDVNSLYPNLIVQYNMSPETIINKIESHYNVEDLVAEKLPNNTEDCIAANGVHFSKEQQGIIPQIIEKLYQERVDTKTEMIELKKLGRQDDQNKIGQLESKQMATKIMLNSLYGAMGNAYFTYFDLRIASAVTTSGQLTIKWAEKAINNYMNKVLKTNNKDYVIAIDTDSCYITFDELVKQTCQGKSDEQIVQYLDKVCKQAIEPVLEKEFEHLHQYMGSYKNRIVMKREAIASAGIWTAKKRYVLNIHNNEGVTYNPPKLKIMGIEAVKSSTPAVCREKMKEAFKIAISGSEEEMQEFIKTFREQFSTLSPDEVSFPRGVSDVVSKAGNDVTLYMKGTPIHVRGAILYNHYLKKKGLDSKYELISSGDKVKFTYLKLPNPIHENVIAFPGFLPKELGLEAYIDYDLQYQKTFVEPLSAILTSIKWSPVKINTIDQFF